MRKTRRHCFYCLLAWVLSLCMFPVMARAANETAPAADEVIQFSDPMVEFLIRQGLRIHDRDILVSDMRTLQTFINNSAILSESETMYDVKDLSDLAYCANLQDFQLEGASVTSLEPLRDLAQLRNIWLVDCPGITDLSPLAGKEYIWQVLLHNISATDLSPIFTLPNLYWFGFTNSLDTDAVPIDISPLAKASELTYVYIDMPVVDHSPLLACDLGGVGLYDLERGMLSQMLEAWPKLFSFFINTSNLTNEDLALFTGSTIEYIALENCAVDDLSPLTQQLYSLTVINCPLTDLSGLENQKSIADLHVDFCAVTDISPLASLTKLQFLSLIGNDIADISPLEKLPHLESLYLSIDAVEDITPLANIPSLQTFTFQSDGKYSQSDIEALLPDVEVRTYTQ